MLAVTLWEYYQINLLFKLVVAVSAVIIGGLSILLFFSELLCPKLLNAVIRRCTEKVDCGWVGLVTCFASLQAGFIIFSGVNRVFFPATKDSFETMIVGTNSCMGLMFLFLNPIFLLLLCLVIFLFVIADSIPLVTALYSARYLRKLIAAIFLHKKTIS